VCVCAVCVVLEVTLNRELKVKKRPQKMSPMQMFGRLVDVSRVNLISRCGVMLLAMTLLTQNFMAGALPASGGSCDSVRDVMTSLKLAQTAMVSESPVAG
jgi:hypothetical protein